jgi:ubiquinone/menaquinone biosynthesis C-methylase UbiE
VADLGGGRRFLYAQAVPDQVEIWSIDIDQNELDLNQDVQKKICGDVSKTLPVEDNFFDLIISRALLEHVTDNKSAFQEMSRILKPNGSMVHLIPARNSTFGIAARIFPFEKLKNLLHMSVPDAKGQVEFPIFYDKCTPKQMKDLLNELGFRKIGIEVCYYASGYFYSVFPLYLFIVLYQYIIRQNNLSSWSQYMIVYLTK